MANQAGRPIAPARKLVALVMGTIAAFLAVFGIGMASWAVVVFGIALLALSIALGMVNVVRRGARAWVAGNAEVKAISPSPTSSSAVYGRAEIQAVIVAPGLPTSEVTIREPRVPVAKWPVPGDTLPITVDVDDMRRVRIDWDEAGGRLTGEDPPPPPPPPGAAEFGDPDDTLDDDLLGEVPAPPWHSRPDDWESAPDPYDESPVVIRDTPDGRIVEGELVDRDDDLPPLPRRAPASTDAASTDPASTDLASTDPASSDAADSDLADSDLAEPEVADQAGAAPGRARSAATSDPASPAAATSRPAAATASASAPSAAADPGPAPSPSAGTASGTAPSAAGAPSAADRPPTAGGPSAFSDPSAFGGPSAAAGPPPAPSGAGPAAGFVADEGVSRARGPRPSPRPRPRPHGTATATVDPETAAPAQRSPHREDAFGTDIPLDDTLPPTAGARTPGPATAAGPASAPEPAERRTPPTQRTAAGADAGSTEPDPSAAGPVPVPGEVPAEAAPSRSPWARPRPTRPPASPSPVSSFPTAPQPVTPPPTAPEPTGGRPTAPPPAFTPVDEIDVPLDADPDVVPESTPRAAQARAEDLIAPPPGAEFPDDPAGPVYRSPSAYEPPSASSTRFATNAAHEDTVPTEAFPVQSAPEQPKHGAGAVVAGAAAAVGAAVAAVKRLTKPHEHGPHEHGPQQAERQQAERQQAERHEADAPALETPSAPAAWEVAADEGPQVFAAGSAGLGTRQAPETPAAPTPAPERRETFTAGPEAPDAGRQVPEAPPEPSASPEAATREAPVDTAGPHAADDVPAAGTVAAEAGAATPATEEESPSVADSSVADSSVAAVPATGVGAAGPARSGGSRWADLTRSSGPDDNTDDLITAYPSARPGPAGAIHGVGITILVTNLDRSVAFYRDLLGFFVIDSGTGSAVLASGDTRLVLRTVDSLAAAAGRLIYLNLEVGDVEAVYEELRSKGVRFVHQPRPVNRGDRLELWSAAFEDPDGHNVAITQWRATR